jgi:hypothetical protein
MPKVKFKVFYKNGMVGLDVAAEETVELTDEQLAFVRTDIREPESALEVLKEPKVTKTTKSES